MSAEVVAKLSQALDESEGRWKRLDEYHLGTQPLAFLSDQAREALGSGFRSLSVNFARLAAEAPAERLRVVGIMLENAEAPDAWARFESSGLAELQHELHRGIGRYGLMFASVWVDQAGRVLGDVWSPKSCTVVQDRPSGVVIRALRRWTAEGRAYAVLLTPDRVTRYRSKSHVPEGGTVPAHGWVAQESWVNPLGRVPVVPFINGGRWVEDAESEMEVVADLVDALNKTTADMLVTSEYYARPRRWATGIEVVEDEEGNPVDPFVEGPRRILQAENEAARFGEFSSSSLAAYESSVRILTSQIGALSGLPPHYLAAHQDQPTSADAIRSAEASLVSKVLGKQRALTRPWAEVVSLVEQVSTRRRPARVELLWANPETRTPAQEADAAAKLVQAGILPADEALLDLGYTPERVRRIASDRELARVRTAMNGGGNVGAA